MEEQHWENFLKHMNSLPEEEIRTKIEKDNRIAEKDYIKFKKHFEKEECYFCGNSLNYFNRDSICLHWLLRPKGVKAKDISMALNKFGYFRSSTYIRWVTNQDKYISSINDLKCEGDVEAVFHWTAEFKEIKWTFLCKNNDFEGHKTTECNFPHYHVEVKLNDQKFVTFNKLHIRFTEEDLFKFKVNTEKRISVEFGYGIGGAGMQDAMSIDPELIVEHSQNTEDPENAVYHIQSILEAKDGEYINMDNFFNAIKESKNTGSSVAKQFIKKNLDPKIFISSPDSLLEKNNRTEIRKKKD